MLQGKPIQIFNHGKLQRDFTYIDDIVTGIMAVTKKKPIADENGAHYKLYNIGNHQPIELLEFVDILENTLRKEGILNRDVVRELLPMQQGDVFQTYADITEMQCDFGFQPTTNIETGLEKYIQWHKEYIRILCSIGENEEK